MLFDNIFSITFGVLAIRMSKCVYLVLLCFIEISLVLYNLSYLFTGIDIHVPSFQGSSYLQFVGLRRTVLSFTEIEIVFKADDSNGLILYNGYTSDRSGDFISLGLVNGFLEYRFDLGTGPAIIR